jgi:hypothetical protein
MQTHEILRRFPGDGQHVHQPGDAVDASAWPNASALESQGYMRAVSLPTAEPRRRGRPAATQEEVQDGSN